MRLRKHIRDRESCFSLLRANKGGPRTARVRGERRVTCLRPACIKRPLKEQEKKRKVIGGFRSERNEISMQAVYYLSAYRKRREARVV